MEEELSHADESLKAARLLIDSQLFREAILKLYYALFPILRALLFAKGLEPKSHEGVSHYFNIHFVREGLFSHDHNRFFKRLQFLRAVSKHAIQLPSSIHESKADLTLSSFLSFFGRRPASRKRYQKFIEKGTPSRRRPDTDSWFNHSSPWLKLFAIIKHMCYLLMGNSGGKMRIRIDPHTLERLEERGATEQEIQDVIETGFTIPAKHGRTGKAKVYEFKKERHGIYYDQKRVEVFYIIEENVIVTVTVYVFYGKWEA